MSLEIFPKGWGFSYLNFLPTFFRLTYWIKLSDEKLFKQALKRQYFSEVMLRRDDLKWRDKPETIALKHGLLLLNLGNLSLKDPQLNPSTGVFLFWNIVRELPYYTKDDPGLKKEWYLVKDLIIAMMLYHNPYYKHKIDEVNKQRLLKAGIKNVPKLSTNRFRKIAIVASLIDVAVEALEQQGEVNIESKLKRRISKYRNKLQAQGEKISAEEIHFYYQLAKKIAAEFPAVWRSMEF